MEIFSSCVVHYCSHEPHGLLLSTCNAADVTEELNLIYFNSFQCPYPVTASGYSTGQCSAGGLFFFYLLEYGWVSHLPRVFCKLLATAFQLPDFCWSSLGPHSSPQPGSDLLPKGLGSCALYVMTGSQAKLIMVIIFIMRNSSRNSNRSLCLLYLGTCHTHRQERLFKGTNEESRQKQVRLRVHQAFFSAI